MTASRSRELQFDPPYDSILGGILAFRTLVETEDTIRRLEKLRQCFLASSDKKGVEYCRQVGALGRRRAELIARNRRVAAEKRSQKQEAALWFRIWLETPDLFEDWLSLRRKTGEFLKLQEFDSRD